MARPDSLENNRQRSGGRIYAAPLVYLSEQLILNTVLPGLNIHTFSVRCTMYMSTIYLFFVLCTLDVGIFCCWQGSGPDRLHILYSWG